MLLNKMVAASGEKHTEYEMAIMMEKKAGGDEEISGSIAVNSLTTASI